MTESDKAAQIPGSSFLHVLRMRRTQVGSAIYVLVSLCCTQIPLLNYLGFEFSFCIALLGSFLSGFLTIGAMRTAPTGVAGERAIVPLFRGILLTHLSLLLIPLGIMSANALLVKNCSMIEGVAFFILIPVVSVVFSSCVGVFCAAHYRFPRTAFVCCVLATVIYALLLGYFTPAIYSYNFFYGYFPGLTYDEVLTITWTMVVFRLLTLLVGGFFFWLAWLLVKNTSSGDPVWKKGTTLLRILVHPGRRYLTGAIILVIAALYYGRCDLGFETSEGYVQRALKGRFESDHFAIFYDPASISEEEIHRIGAEHEFRLKQIMDAFALQKQTRISSYIYPSAEAKQRLIGAGNTNIAKPWRNEIHISKQSLDGTLKHELVHVVAGRFGAPVIHASFSTGLVEGLAMAVEWDWGHRTLHRYAGAMQRAGVAPSLPPLMRLTGFAAHSSSVSYVLAGSFCRFLIDRYGMRKMAQLYGDNDYTGHYGRTLEELVAEWTAFLGRIQVEESDRDAIEVLFRRPPIFEKVCARSIAKQLEQARKSFVERDYGTASVLYGGAFHQTHGYESLAGYLWSELRLGNYRQVTAVCDSLTGHDSHAAQFLPLFIAGADAFWAVGNRARALDLSEALHRADISDGLTEAALVRLAALRDEKHEALFLHYFQFDGNDTLRVALLDSIVSVAPGSDLAQYLKGRALLRIAQYEKAFDALQASNVLVEERELDAFRCTMMGTALFRLKRYQEAKGCFWLSLNSVATEVAVNNVNTWIDRCEWMATHGL